jgi:hypothetical protein
VGVPKSTMKAITDEAYKDFVAQLEANGYNVMDRSKLTSLDAYKKATSATSPTQYDDIKLALKPDVLYFAPTGQELFFMVGDKSSTFGGLSSGIGFSNPGMAFQVVADTDKLAIVTGNCVVNFVNTKGYGGSHRSTSSVTLDSGLSVVPGSSVGIIGGCDRTFSMVLGSLARMSSTNSGTFVVIANPRAYASLTEGLLKDANAQLVAAMAANRWYGLTR